MTLDIGEVVAASGLPTSTLHLWERRGLITPSGRTGLRRQYPDTILLRLGMIVAAQRSGFTLDEIRAMLAPGGFDADRSQLTAKIEELRARRDELSAAIEGLEHARNCPHPSFDECPTFLSWVTDMLPVDRD